MDRRPRQRLDKWLWHARFGRTRTLAAKSVQAGNIRLNKVKITKPAHSVAAGDILTILIGDQIRVVRVTGLSDRRLSPELAASLFEDLTAPMRESAPAETYVARPDWSTGAAHSSI